MSKAFYENQNSFEKLIWKFVNKIWYECFVMLKNPNPAQIVIDQTT